MTEVKDSLGAISLVFTVLAFFVGRRVDRFTLEELGTFSPMAALEAGLDLALAAVAGFAIVVVWPLLDSSGALTHIGDEAHVLPNLLALVVIGFGALVLIESFLGLGRVAVAAGRNQSTLASGIGAVLILAAAISVALLAR